MCTEMVGQYLYSEIEMKFLWKPVFLEVVRVKNREGK